MTVRGEVTSWVVGRGLTFTAYTQHVLSKGEMMSGQIDYSLQVSDTFNSKKKVVAQGQTRVTVAGDAMIEEAVSIPTTAGGTVVPVHAGTLGWVYMRNMDPTNTIKFGPTSGGAIVDLGEMLPGEEAWFRLVPGVVLRAISLTSACFLNYKIYPA